MSSKGVLSANPHWSFPSWACHSFRRNTLSCKRQVSCQITPVHIIVWFPFRESLSASFPHGSFLEHQQGCELRGAREALQSLRRGMARAEAFFCFVFGFYHYLLPSHQPTSTLSLGQVLLDRFSWHEAKLRTHGFQGQ